MIIHLGKNPVNGGKPPSESMIIRVIVGIRGILFHTREKDNIVVEDVEISSMKVVVVIIIYKIRFNNIIVGLYIKIAVIQPIWAIDEYAMILRNCV